MKTTKSREEVDALKHENLTLRARLARYEKTDVSVLIRWRTRRTGGISVALRPTERLGKRDVQYLRGQWEWCEVWYVDFEKRTLTYITTHTGPKDE